jgi:phospholipase C
LRAALFTAALSGPNLPAVSFVKPLGNYNEHPGYADLVSGQECVSHLVKAVQDSAYWADTAIIITYDENGGRYDHVAPPRLDRWGDGARAHHHHLALRQEGFCGPHTLRHHLDPEVHRNALEPAGLDLARPLRQ